MMCLEEADRQEATQEMLRQALWACDENALLAALHGGAKIDEGLLGYPKTNALGWCASAGIEDMAALLLREGADPNLPVNGWTAGHWAAAYDRQECLRLLLEAGWRWVGRNDAGLLAEDLARQAGASECEHLLRDARIAAEKEQLNAVIADAADSGGRRSL